MAEQATSGSWQRFTMHVDFMATDGDEARIQAEAYALALLHLRGEVDSHTARVSAGGNWSRSEPVFCGAPGPVADDVCIEGADHPGPHHGPGMSGRWRDADVPRCPDVPP